MKPPVGALELLTDEQIEKLAVEHEAFGFGRVDERGLTTHGFDPDGLRNFARALLRGGVERALLDPQPVAWLHVATGMATSDPTTQDRYPGQYEPLYRHSSGSPSEALRRQPTPTERFSGPVRVERLTQALQRMVDAPDYWTRDDYRAEARIALQWLRVEM